MPRIPVSTYRLQFNRTFTFAHAEKIVPYLHALGITDCYSSSYLKAVPGSPHGYDLVDPRTLNQEVGTEQEHGQFVRALNSHDMGQILDLVPNHMGIRHSANAWWQDVLENGPSSPYSTYFDIDWDPVKPELKDKVLLPILGAQYGTELENQKIALHYEDGGFHIRYHDYRLPVAPKPSARILTHGLDKLVQQTAPGDPGVEELQSIITALEHLPSRSEQEPHRVAERYREKRIIKRRLDALLQESPAVRAFVLDNVRQFNGTKGDPRSFDLLDGLFNDQAYRLAHWRVAAEEINYRRFFDVNELAAIRMEDPAVFSETHQLVFRLLREGAVTGLRIDHVDGLYDPAGYLHQLQAWARTELSPPASDQEPAGQPLYLIVEKIFSRGETLPEDWPVHGTTGYDFLNLLNGLFVDVAHAQVLDDIYTRFIRRRISFEDLTYEAKLLIMQVSMASEINVLGHQLNLLSERDRRSRDFTLNSLTHAIREIIACFPVYRTYVTPGSESVTEHDHAYIQRAVANAKRKNPALSGLVFDFVRDLLLKRTDDRLQEHREEALRFVMKFQQTTSPVMAKGVEDTAFYICNRLVSLNEVGGDPDDFGTPLSAFHEWMKERQARWPYTLSATSTHDTKRSEDMRARINVLSEIPHDWRAYVVRWSKLNRKHKALLDGQPAPDRNDEYLLYQTLIGAWPFGPLNDDQYLSFCDRIQSYMSKATKEAKAHTSWVNPHREYDDGVRQFVEAILGREVANPFLADFLSFQERVAQYGMWNSLAQLVLKIASPGIPDFYQGAELWDFSLVDPDNRRTVDFTMRDRLLSELQRRVADARTDRRPLVRDLLESRADGRIKLYVTMTGLTYRRDHALLFRKGDYVPLESQGRERDHLCAFARIRGEHAIVAVVPRLVAGLIPDAKTPPLGWEVWGNTWVTVPSWRPGSSYRNIFTGETLTSETLDGQQALHLAQVFLEFPVVLLERVP